MDRPALDVTAPAQAGAGEEHYDYPSGQAIKAFDRIHFVYSNAWARKLKAFGTKAVRDGEKLTKAPEAARPDSRRRPAGTSRACADWGSR